MMVLCCTTLSPRPSFLLTQKQPRPEPQCWSVNVCCGSSNTAVSKHNWRRSNLCTSRSCPATATQQQWLEPLWFRMQMNPHLPLTQLYGRLWAHRRKTLHTNIFTQTAKYTFMLLYTLSRLRLISCGLAILLHSAPSSPPPLSLFSCSIPLELPPKQVLANFFPLR